MKKSLFGLAALPFLAGLALAGQPIQLGDAQLDKVTAGFQEINVLPTTAMAGYEVTAGDPRAPITLQTPGADPHTFCLGCPPFPLNMAGADYESPLPSFDRNAIPGVGLFRE